MAVVAGGRVVVVGASAVVAAAVVVVAIVAGTVEAGSDARGTVGRTSVDVVAVVTTSASSGPSPTMDASRTMSPIGRAIFAHLGKPR